MLTGRNSAVSGQLSGLMDKAGAKIASAIQNASAKTGVDFSYLLQQAKIESSFKADAKAGTSSATGLYQFIDKTWLSMVDKYGDKYGLSDITNKKQILELRKDPELCSLMAAEFASDNKDHLEKCTTKKVGATELYMAHFMGAGGATKFLNAMDTNPNANAAVLFPDAARANKNVFFDKSGQPKSLEQVYAQFDKKFAIKTDDVSRPVAVAEIPKQETVDPSTDNVLAAFTPVAPLFSKNSSLFTNTAIAQNDIASPPSSLFPKNFYSIISPIDVLELMKTGYSGHRVNS